MSDNVSHCDDHRAADRAAAPTVALPSGWQVRDNPLVGVEMLDETGQILSSHPWDSATWRRATIWGFTGELRP